MRQRSGMTQSELRRAAFDLAKPNVVDRLVEFIDPNAGARRRRARFQNSILSMAGGFDGGDLSRRDMKSKAGVRGNAPDEDVVNDLDKTRRISRNLYYNNSIARGLIRTMSVHVISTGLRLKSRPNREALGLTPEQAKAWALTTEREFRFHFGGVHCDAERKHNLARIGFMAFMQRLLNGESLTLLPKLTDRSDSTPYVTGLQLIESDRLSTPNDKRGDKTISAGIRFTEAGAPTEFFFSRFHPGDMRKRAAQSWQGVTAFGPNGRRNVLHMFDQERPQQSRGVPFLAPIMTALKSLGDFTEAELQATVVSSFLSVFVKSPDGTTELDNILPDANGGSSGARSSDEDIALGPAAIINLGADEEVTTVTPGRPNTAFDGFVRSISQQLSAATQIPYEVLFKAFNSSYSASKAAFLEMYRIVRYERQTMADGWYQPIYEAWLDEAVAIGRVIAPGYFEDPFVRQAWRTSMWIGDAVGDIDETKQITAATQRIDAKLSTRQRESLEINGESWDEIAQELADEDAVIEELGLQPPAPVAGAPPADQSADEQDKADKLEKVAQ